MDEVGLLLQLVDLLLLKEVRFDQALPLLQVWARFGPELALYELLLQLLLERMRFRVGLRPFRLWSIASDAALPANALPAPPSRIE